jgi:tRNA pseudouridine55 synthase
MKICLYVASLIMLSVFLISRSLLHFHSNKRYGVTTTLSMVSRAARVPSGLCVVHKPIGISSATATTKIKRILQNGIFTVTGQKVNIKVGHGGTLDPLAEGLLVLGVGEGTKLLSSYLVGSKAYRTTAKLGESTDTLDSTGKVTEVIDSSHVVAQSIVDILPAFTGNISQVPPMFSALKIKGARLYELARQGINVEREPRNVTVYQLNLHSFDYPTFVMDVECSGGFYVRTLIDDVAKSLNSAAHMTALERIKQGCFGSEDCLKESDWEFDKLKMHIMRCTEKISEDINIDVKSLEWKRLKNM